MIINCYYHSKWNVYLTITFELVICVTCIVFSHANSLFALTLSHTESQCPTRITRFFETFALGITSATRRTICWITVKKKKLRIEGLHRIRRKGHYFTCNQCKFKTYLFITYIQFPSRYKRVVVVHRKWKGICVRIVYCAPRAKTGFCVPRKKLSPEAKPRGFHLHTTHKRP